MSIYATWLVFDDDAVKTTREQEKITGLHLSAYVSRSPWKYQGSHLLPDVTDESVGHFSVSGIPDHIRQRDAKPPFDWLRFDVVGHGSATVILDREQATKLRDMLTEWLTRTSDETAP